MKKKSFRVLSFICAFALALSLCSMFSFAAQPESESVTQGVEGRTSYIALGEVKENGTYLYNSPSTGSGYVYNGNIPVGTYVYIRSVSGSFFYADVKFSGRTYTGYVEKDHVRVA